MAANRWPAIAYCLLSWAGAFYHLILFSFLKRDIQAALGLSPVAVAWIDGLTFAAAAGGGMVLGRAADHGARRLVLAIAPALPAAGALLLAQAHDATTVVLARLIVGFGVGGGWGVGHATLAEIYEGPKRLRATAILQTGGPLGVIGASLVGSVLIPSSPDAWRVVLTWSAATAVIAALDPWAMRGLPFPSRAALRAPQTPPPKIPPAAFRIFALLVLQMTAYWCTFGWLPSHLMGHGAARTTVGWTQMVIAVTQAIADLGFGWLSPKVGLRRLFAICNLAFGAGVLALAAAFERIAAHPTALAATVAMIGLGSGSWAAFGVLYAEFIPSRIRSTVSSFSYHLARASQLAVQPLVAALGATETSLTPFLLTAALASWAGGLYVRRLRPTPPAPARATTEA